MKNVDIVGLGEVVLDWVAEIPHFPMPDEKVDAISEYYFPGGVTANYLVAIARLGGLCGFLGAVGKDSYGKFLINDFIKEKVDTRFIIEKQGHKTPVNFIFIAKGEKSIIQSPHMQTTKIENLDIDEYYIANSKLLHTTLIHPNISREAFKISKKHDVKISIDLESQIAQRGWNNLKDLLLKADILIPNKKGAQIITKTQSPEEAAKILVKKGINIVIITLGSRGVLITTPDYQKRINAYSVDKIVDTTGAGDTFNGAFSIGYWINGWGLEKSCKYGMAAASLKIQKLGARTGMPNNEDVMKFLRENDSDYS
jgi:ribokinase